MTADVLERRIDPGASLLLDTSVVIAYIGGGEPTSELARQVIDGFGATGRNPLRISAVTVTELLVRPLRRGPQAGAVVEDFLDHFADLRVIDVDDRVARAAARLRAERGLRTPDALVLASAVVAGVDLVLTNDRSWVEALAPDRPAVLCLPDLVRTKGA